MSTIPQFISGPDSVTPNVPLCTHGPRMKPHVRIMDAPFKPLQYLVEWPADFTTDERNKLIRGGLDGVVFRGDIRYYEADL